MKLRKPVFALLSLLVLASLFIASVKIRGWKGKCIKETLLECLIAENENHVMAYKLDTKVASGEVFPYPYLSTPLYISESKALSASNLKKLTVEVEKITFTSEFDYLCFTPDFAISCDFAIFVFSTECMKVEMIKNGRTVTKTVFVEEGKDIHGVSSLKDALISVFIGRGEVGDRFPTEQAIPD